MIKKLVLILVLFSGKAAFSYECPDIPSCLESHARIDRQLKALLYEQTSYLTNFLSDESGRILKGVSFADAREACSSRGMRLPTARELAAEAMTFGAYPLQEHVDDKNPPIGTYRHDFSIIKSLEIDGRRDQFYYSKRGHSQKPNSLGLATWSSSTSERFLNQVYILTSMGEIIFVPKTADGGNEGVRCYAKP